MGQQQSKSASSGSRPPSSSQSLQPPGLESLPSFSKSDTQGSSRSFRGLRSKIPGSAKTDGQRASIDGPRASTDSPRSSGTGLTNVESGGEKSDAASIKSSASAKSPASSKASRARAADGIVPTSPTSLASPTSPEEEEEEGTISPRSGSPVRSPSPTQSNTIGKGHKAVDDAQENGEVDNVSDAPPSAISQPSLTAKPGESILVKRPHQVIPRAKEHRFKRKNDPLGVSPGGLFGSSPGKLGTSPAAPLGGSPGGQTATLESLDLDDMISRLLDAGYSAKVTKTLCLKNIEIASICAAARELFLSQPALIELTAPVKIVGDIHGQYTDLIRLFEMCGFPPAANYLFLGDYVDRGKQSLETILLLMCYKLKYPENFFLLRGNHECANVTRVYGFYDECKRRTNIKTWKTFIDTFNCLPIASIVAGKIFCVHGGLSPSLSHMDDIRQIARPTDVPDYGLLNDLLWSDPADIDTDWESNERGVSYCFGKKVIMEFLQRHDFDLVCRAHMVVEDGYDFFTDRILVTVFSAPNYCGEFDNWGAVMSVNDELLCSFDLLKPLDSSALKNHIKKGRNKRNSMLNSPPAVVSAQSY